MNRNFYLILLFSICMKGCVKHGPINFSSSDAFFNSLNEKKVIKKENKNSVSVISSLKENNIDKTEKKIVQKSVLLTLSSYKKKLKEKVGSNELTIAKIFKKPNLIINHGKIKNLQFHLKFCHLDLFFLQKDKTYILKHFDIRPSSMSSNLNKKKCVKELNNEFILIHDPK